MQHHAETADAFSGDHATNCQFHLRGCQPAIHERSIFPQLGISLQR
jgi:hypothetical protein